MAKKLTQIAVEKIKPHPTKRLEIPDAGKPGLYLIVQPSRKKSWAVRYRHNGKTRKLTLDGFPSLKVAHKLAQAELDKVAEGRDVAAEKRAATRAKREEAGDDSFEAVAAEFVERHVKKNNREASQREVERLLKKDVLPAWADKRIDAITRRDVIELLDGIVDRGGGLTANRALAVVRKLFNWARARGIVTTSPVEGVKAPVAENVRDRVLTDGELRWFWQACQRVGYPFGNFGALLLLSGQRRTEVAGMRRGELEGRLWRIPGSRTKNGEAHDVPLSGAALAVINAAPRIKDDFVFTVSGEAHVKTYSAAKAAIDRAMLDIAREERGEDVQIPRWTFHDLRRTAASGMARLGIALPVIEKVLNHSSGSFAGIVGVYQRHEFTDEKRDGLEAWSRFVELVADVPLWAAREARLAAGNDEDRKKIRLAFRDAILEGGERWQRYLKLLRSGRSKVVESVA